jgi:hypothetical protein
MAEQKRSGRGKGVPHNPLVEALASDPNQPPKKATRLFGYPGPAADAKSTRLWLDTDLTSYVDVPNDAILHSQTLDNDEGTILWVDPTATLTQSATQEQEVQADFLAGSIAQGNLAGAGTNLGLGTQWPTIERTIATVCKPTLARTNCPPTELPPCGPSYNVPCASKGFVCISVNVPCPTSEPVICGPIQSVRCVSRGIACPETTPVFTLGRCPTPWEGVETINTPIINQVGPFRPQQ